MDAAELRDGRGGRDRTERRLRQQNERRDDFVDPVAHDLRNPLSVATVFTDLAESSASGPRFELTVSVDTN